MCSGFDFADDFSEQFGVLSDFGACVFDVGAGNVEFHGVGSGVGCFLGNQCVFFGGVAENAYDKGDFEEGFGVGDFFGVLVYAGVWESDGVYEGVFGLDDGGVGVAWAGVDADGFGDDGSCAAFCG